MKQFLGRLFGSSETTEKVVDGVIGGLDAAWFTPEEKSRAALEALQLRIEWAKATSNSRLARRVPAFMIVGNFLFFLNIALGLGLWGTAEQMQFALDMANKLTTPVTVILGFYFAAQILSKK